MHEGRNGAAPDELVLGEIAGSLMLMTPAAGPSMPSDSKGVKRLGLLGHFEWTFSTSSVDIWRWLGAQ